MKIYFFSDISFLDMKDKFEFSFKDSFEKKFTFLENINTDRTKPGSGIDIWLYKTKMIIDAIIENSYCCDNTITISDIDIIFYKPVVPTILSSMQGYDICFQKEHNEKGINIGFMTIKCNTNTLRFWKYVYEIIGNTNRWDQEVVNDLIYNKKYKIKYNLFPSQIWNWSQGNLTKDILLHHANCVSDKQGKYQQMEFVYDFINN